jgi:pimeloyl-ACP methyl ester carboxylesterase
VLEAGGASWSLDWTPVQERLAAITRVCSYDRAGFGWSDEGHGPRHAQALADELHAALTAAGLPGPYLLVGASFGGHVVRLFAAAHPDEVAAVVLLDARHEDMDAEMPPSWKRLERSGRAAQRVLWLLSRLGLLGLVGRLGGERSLPPATRYLPEGLVETYLAVGFRPKYFRTNLAEFDAIAESDAQVRRARPAPDRPTVVVRHGVPDLFASLTPAEASLAETTWQRLQEDLAARLPQARLVVAAASGHAIQLHQPELVVEVVRERVLAHRAASPSA